MSTKLYILASVFFMAIPLLDTPYNISSGIGGSMCILAICWKYLNQYNKG